jgi:glutamate-5-semialdehyde dehydrogenase
MEKLTQFLKSAKAAAHIMSVLPGKKRSAVLNEMAQALLAEKEAILQANAKDMKNAETAGLSEAMCDRLLLNDKRLGEMATALREIAALRDPVGRVIDGWVTDDELKIEKVAVPIGVVGVIYESRPNVTADVAALCFKSGNVAILKGGKEAIHSNTAIASVLQGVLKAHALPEAAIALLPDGSREAVAWMVKQDRYLDLIVPRGGEALIRFVSENATVPVVKHDKGVCHLYVHIGADYKTAERVAINAKTQRPSACNAIETLLIDDKVATAFLPRLKKAFEAAGTRLRGCEKTREQIGVDPASEADWDEEYLSNTLAIKVVSGIDEAIAHIHRHGSSHSEAIVTTNHAAAEQFLNSVDAACVYVNASTRFTDGGQFGFGAEVGISTNKLHARGPMGVSELTTYKFQIYGNGQIRS